MSRFKSLLLSLGCVAVAGISAAVIDPSGGEEVDASIGPVALENFRKLPDLHVLNFDDGVAGETVKVDGVKIQFTGLELSDRAGYFTSAPNSLLGVGQNLRSTASIVFSQPVQSVGMTVLFATGTIQVKAIDINGEVVASVERNGQGDPQDNGSWEDYFFGVTAADAFKPIQRVEFSRSNLNDGALPEFAIDDLCWVAGSGVLDMPLPEPRETDSALIGGAGMKSVSPQVAAGNPVAAEQNGMITLSNQLDGCAVTYTLNAAEGLASLRATINQQPQVALGNGWEAKILDQVATPELIASKVDGAKVLLQYRWHTAQAQLPVLATLELSGGTLLIHLEAAEGKALTLTRPKPAKPLSLSDADKTDYGALPFFGFAGDLFYLPEHRLFYSFQVDWTRSNATTPAPNIQYAEVDGAAMPLQETIAITLADTLPKVLPSIPNPVSPYREKIASSIVMEFWYGHFDELGELMAEYHRYGMDDMIVLMHRWQNGGFDRKYPTIMPPNSSRGGLKSLRSAVREANANGQIIALHENYKDFYPDSPEWNPEDLLVCADGNFQKAWADSREMAPSKIRKYAEPMMNRIKQELGTTGCFLDVHSTHLPWWRVDFRPGVPGAGTFAGTLQPTNELWEMARRIYQGPVFGESYAPTSWIHTGNVDSVMGQGNYAQSLILDFLLLKIRPLAINHGAGYFERWNPRGYVADWQSAPLPIKEYALYSLQEVAFQTAPTIDDKVKHEIAPAATQYYQKRPLVSRLVNQPVTAITYYTLDGRELTSSQAVLLPKKEIKRLREEFADGSFIVLNFSTEPWTVNERLTLAPLSFRAEGPGFSAETNCVDGVFFENWLSDDAYYVNARNYDWLMEPKGTAAMGREGEGAAPILYNDGTAVVQFGPIETDAAISLQKEGDAAWRLRFFPQRQAGFVRIAPALCRSGAVVEALDADGKVIADADVEVTWQNGALGIEHEGGNVWSYRIR